MKQWIIFIALFSANHASACGPWYPYGEEVRFSLFDPAQFDDGSMSDFYYTANDFGNRATLNETTDPNVQLWFEYCNGKVELADIFTAIYQVDKSDFKSRNKSIPMIAYLLSQNDIEALKYIEFAKSCSSLNSVHDSWEREDIGSTHKRKKKISEALKRARKSKNPQLIKRYQFLALRLEFYNNDIAAVEKRYRANFSGTGKKDILDYWALHFVSVLAPASAETNFQLAQVFVHAPGKRFAVQLAFDRSIELEKVLAHAATDEERANVYIMYAIRDKGQSDNAIKEVYRLDPKSPLLNFLIIRELNKIEDWVLTPRYSMFPPAISGGEYYGEKFNELMADRLKDDRLYAENFALWLLSKDWATTNEVDLYKLASCYLFNIAESDANAVAVSRDLAVDPMLTYLRDQVLLLQKIRLNPMTVFSKEDEILVMDAKANQQSKFLFALAREFEFGSNTTIAAALFSQLNDNNSYYELPWRSPDGTASLSSDFYTDWFFYLEGQYTVEQIENVIDFAHYKVESSDEFGKWLRRNLLVRVNRLHDLVGTKYIRKNDLERAISAFKQVKPGLWDSDEYPYKTYLNANPFYADFMTEHRETIADTVRYNKLQITQKLSEYLKLAENPSTKNRAYYYFQVANCYFNMSYYGNSWMMRRYYSSTYPMESNLEDEAEYFGCLNAKKYYLKAMKHSPTKNLEALCLRMAGRCESYELMHSNDYDYDFDYDPFGGYSGYINSKNKSYSTLKTSYAQSYTVMMENCTSFETYYAQFK